MKIIDLKFWNGGNIKTVWRNLILCIKRWGVIKNCAACCYGKRYFCGDPNYYNRRFRYLGSWRGHCDHFSKL